jgi:23S rRNA (cytidine1920-2'-O)/16S rRNA (cytidine1409-2'-O)-methyltransferase
MKKRLDVLITELGLVQSRSQAENIIKLSSVKVDGEIQTKPGAIVNTGSKIEIVSEQYVSRAGLKLASVARNFGLNFGGQTVLDVGSSTGGFTDYALRHGAGHVIAVDVGTDQLHPTLRNNPRIELHEKTNILNFKTDQKIDLVVMDVSFVSSRELLPHIATLCNVQTRLIIMVKPQFEAGKDQVNKGVIKNERVRRDILSSFETWAKAKFVILDKADSGVSGSKGNTERFYLMKLKASHQNSKSHSGIN